MHGKTRHDRAYYSCRPATNNADQLDRYEGHPKSIYVREEHLREALDHVIATRVFGAERHVFLRQGLADQPAKRDEADARRTRSLRAQIADINARQDRLITELETTDASDRSFRDRLRRRFDSLESDRAAKEHQLAELTGIAPTETDQDTTLLAALPILESLRITDIPETIQRKLYDALQLEIHYDQPNTARIRLTLTDDNVGMVAAGVATRAIATATPPGVAAASALVRVRGGSRRTWEPADDVVIISGIWSTRQRSSRQYQAAVMESFWRATVQFARIEAAAEANGVQRAGIRRFGVLLLGRAGRRAARGTGRRTRR
jgi:hypothetical protein